MKLLHKEETMKEYEVMYVIKPMSDDELHAIVDKFTKLINQEGTVAKVDIWGKKRLAYAIQDIEEGIYVLVTFNGPPSVVRELDRVLRITDEVLRHMIISKGC